MLGFLPAIFLCLSILFLYSPVPYFDISDGNFIYREFSEES